MNERLEGAVHGALAGVMGASCMSVMRMGARRQGLLDKAAPQAVEAWLMKRLHTEPPGGVAGHQALSELFHLGYGLLWGAGWGFALGRRRPGARWGALFGLAQWAVGFLGYLPALRITERAHKVRPETHAVNILSHLVWGAVVAFAGRELERQQTQHTRRGTWFRLDRHVA
jgi:hypothetical protein